MSIEAISESEPFEEKMAQNSALNAAIEANLNVLGF